MFEQASGASLIVIILQGLLQNYQLSNYSQIGPNELAGIRWGISIVHEIIEKSTVAWNAMEYSVREGFLQQLFDLIYYCI